MPHDQGLKFDHLLREGISGLGETFKNGWNGGNKV